MRFSSSEQEQYWKAGNGNMNRTIKNSNRSIIRLAIGLAVLVLANILFTDYFLRFDLTHDKRHTVSDATRQMLHDLDDLVFLQIYLEGELPADYRRLRNAVKEMLDEYRAISGQKIEYIFIDPFENENKNEAEELVKALIEQGLEIRQVAESSADEVSRKTIIAGALVSYHNKQASVNFLPAQKELAEPTADIVNRGISTLEFNLSNAIRKLKQTSPKKIVFIQGQGELSPRQMADFAVSLQMQQYDVSFMDLTSEVAIPQTIDVAIIAKPSKTFREEEKFKIDQYLMHGGKLIWLVEPLIAELDTLMAGKSSFVALDRDLNIDDQLFEYGVRINKELLLDLEANRIPLYPANVAQPVYYPWYFYPVLFPETEHPVVKHLDPLLVRFASTIDTLATPGIQKTVLLHSSRLSTAWKSPVLVRLSLATSENLPPEQFNKSLLPVGVLLEGRFKSVFRARLPGDFIKIYRDSLGMKYREQSEPTQMIILSDGDMIRNEVGATGNPYPLGYYRFNPNYLFANKDFLMNCVDYLTDQYGLIATRTKEFKIRLLDKARVQTEKTKWQLINLGLPILFLVVLAILFQIVRKRKYT